MISANMRTISLLVTTTLVVGAVMAFSSELLDIGGSAFQNAKIPMAEDSNIGRQNSMTSAQVLHSKTVWVQTWEELQGLGDFTPLQPRNLPANAELTRLGFTYFPFPGTSFPTTRNGIVLAQYKIGDGYLIFEHGWGIGITEEAIPTTVPHGRVSAGKYQQAIWVRGKDFGGGVPPSATKADDAYLRLGWRADPGGATAPGWKLSTDTLSLDQLLTIARSLE